MLAFVGFRLVSAARLTVARPTVRARVVQVVRGLRLRHFLPVPVVLTVVVSTAALRLEVPGLDVGWWSAIGGYGNPVAGSTERTVGTPLEWLVPLVFAALLLPGLPLFAEAAERIFRFGAEGWSWPRRLWRSGLAFGLVHLVVGVPIGVALALAVGGLYFLAVYLRAARRRGPSAGLLESTRGHLAYNLVIVVILVVATVVTYA